MIRTIITHDVSQATAKVRFEHLGVTVEDTYDLVAVIPGTVAFIPEGEQLSEEGQETALDYLTDRIEWAITRGDIKPSIVIPQEPEVDPDQLELPL